MIDLWLGRATVLAAATKVEVMDNGAKIIKVPRSLNRNDVEFNRVYEKYRYCPFCKASNKIGSSEWCDSKRWYGKSNGDKGLRALFEEKHHWKVLVFMCYTCGAEWESEPFRTDYPEDVPYEEI